jgi:hypothetical protein
MPMYHLGDEQHTRLCLQFRDVISLHPNNDDHYLSHKRQVFVKQCKKNRRIISFPRNSCLNTATGFHVIMNVVLVEASVTHILVSQRTGSCSADIQDRIRDLINSLHTNHMDKDGHIHGSLSVAPM